MRFRFLRVVLSCTQIDARIDARPVPTRRRRKFSGLRLGRWSNLDDLYPVDIAVPAQCGVFGVLNDRCQLEPPMIGVSEREHRRAAQELSDDIDVEALFGFDQLNRLACDGFVHFVQAFVPKADASRTVGEYEGVDPPIRGRRGRRVANRELEKPPTSLRPLRPQRRKQGVLPVAGSEREAQRYTSSATAMISNPRAK